MGNSKRIFMQAMVASALSIVGNAGIAQSTFPDKPVKVVVPFSPGGSFDVIARHISNGLGKLWGQPVVIENRAGAGGNIGAQNVINRPGDGYTLLFWGDGVLANPLLFPTPPFNAIEDLSGVALVATAPQVLVSGENLSLKTMTDVLKSEQPLNYGTAGSGSPGHLAAELMKRQGAKQLTHIPYRGGGPALADLMGGQIQLVSTGLPATISLIRSGRIHAIAITSKERLASFPEVPTVGETLKGYEVDTWFGFMAPKDTPIEIREKIASDIAKVLSDSKLRKELSDSGFEVKTSSPNELDAKMAKDLAFWKELVEKSGANAK